MTKNNPSLSKSKVFPLHFLTFDSKFKIMTTKCYIVSKYGGHWEDKWDIDLCAFLDENKAKEYVATNEIIKEESLKVTPEEFNMLSELLKDIDSDLSKTIPQLIYEKYPEYSLKDLELTEEYMDRLDQDYIGMNIKTISLCQ